MKAKNNPAKPLYTRLYLIDLDKLLGHRDTYINGEKLPVKEIVENSSTANETEPQKQAQVAYVNCPAYHVKSIINVANLFNSEHPCAVLEYCGKEIPTSEIPIGAARMFPNGAIDTNRPRFPDTNTTDDFISRIRKQQNWLFPKKQTCNM